MSTRTVLVAGGAGALGSAVVRRLAGDGWDVVATVRPGGEHRAAELPGRVVGADLADEHDVRALVDGLPELHAVVDTVGGYAAGGKVHEESPERFE
ncbi:MAG: SDR family NAD(P)-dependent oxidoreductase, partial [Actinomycetota bacterium]|nr:SDR family NAD(P)-dependent oxidoreductase [Actinomycetota bacterium]